MQSRSFPWALPPSISSPFAGAEPPSLSSLPAPSQSPFDSPLVCGESGQELFDLERVCSADEASGTTEAPQDPAWASAGPSRPNLLL